MIADWLERGYLREVDMGGERRYQVRMASRRPREIPFDLWAALKDKIQK